MFDDELFGTPEQISLMKRGRNLWSLLRDNPHYSYSGRLVLLSEPDEDPVDILSALARLQGAGVCSYYPAALAPGLFARLEALGLTTDRHEHYWGGEQALASSLRVRKEYSLPDDLTVSAVDAGTPREVIAAIAELCRSCGVMPIPGARMRGQTSKGLCLIATDRQGQPVATASAFMVHHPQSSRASDAFWGILATREDRRGQGIALQLGAQVIIDMWENHGARGFTTGVRQDNVPSKTLCNKLGVGATDWIYAECMDEAVLGGPSVTK